MTLTDALGSDVAVSFDDEIAASVYKAALIEAYCRGEISAPAVQRIFDQTPALRGA